MMFARWVYILGFVAIALSLAAGALVLTDKDPAYRLSELADFGRHDSQDALIAAAAARHGVDPLLVKAVIWQESRFQPEKLGAHGERGLMQVTEPAAQDWVQALGVETFVPEDLLDPKTNIEVGTWYLAQALKHWSRQEVPANPIFDNTRSIAFYDSMVCFEKGRPPVLDAAQVGRRGITAKLRERNIL